MDASRSSRRTGKPAVEVPLPPIAVARPWRILMLLVAGAFAFWITDARAASAPAAPKITPAELEQALYAYADRYTTHIVSATESIERGNPSPEQRRLAHLLKLVSVSSMYDTVTQADAFSKLLDVLAVVTLQSYAWIDEDRAEREFGEKGEPLRRAFRESRNDIWNLAARVLRADQLQQVDAVILDWRRQNPKVDIIASIRFDQLSAERKDGAVEEIRKASGLFAEIAETRKTVDDARHLAERAFYQAKRMPLLVSWQMEALLNETLANPDLRKTLGAAESLAASADRVSLTVEKMPALVSSERQAILKTLDEQHGRVSSLLGDVRQTAAAGDRLGSTALKVSESGERLTLNLRETVTGLTETTRAADALLAKLSQAASWSPDRRRPPITSGHGPQRSSASTARSRFEWNRPALLPQPRPWSRTGPRSA